MLQEHTLGKQFQTRPNAEHSLLLFAAHGPLCTNPGRSWVLLGRSWAALGPLLAALGRSWAALGTTRKNHQKIDAENDRF